MLIGFEPEAQSTSKRDEAKIRWQQPLAPGDGLGAIRSAHFGEFDLRAGRAVAAYDDITGKSHIVAVDVVTVKFHGFALTPTRLYVGEWSRIEVRDAATGRLLGGVGKPL